MGKIYFDFVVGRLGYGADEGEFATCSEGDSYGDVLSFGSGGVECSIVVCCRCFVVGTMQRLVEKFLKIQMGTLRCNKKTHSRRIMMKRFPIGTIPIPIKPSPDTLLLNPKIFAQTIDDPFKGGTTLRILGDQMGAFVPGDPFGGPIGFLELCHFFD